ncbi:hypothetical protein CP981_06160 [Streptomyces platensis]|uniref:Uncharacterized protein n=1 Tax=Streptomyces platensis TaxID=58346 RepID=A0AAE6NGC3_STRPT|nr:hypothetical protein CP981_06160 [Streptomyces platensis]
MSALCTGCCPCTRTRPGRRPPYGPPAAIRKGPVTSPYAGTPGPSATTSVPPTCAPWPIPRNSGSSSPSPSAS